MHALVNDLTRLVNIMESTFLYILNNSVQYTQNICTHFIICKNTTLSEHFQNPIEKSEKDTLQ